MQGFGVRTSRRGLPRVFRADRLEPEDGPRHRVRPGLPRSVQAGRPSLQGSDPSSRTMTRPLGRTANRGIPHPGSAWAAPSSVAAIELPRFSVLRMVSGSPMPVLGDNE